MCDFACACMLTVDFRHYVHYDIAYFQVSGILPCRLPSCISLSPTLSLFRSGSLTNHLKLINIGPRERERDRNINKFCFISVHIILVNFNYLNSPISREAAAAAAAIAICTN